MASKSRVGLIIPVEIQVRELDAKILLACVAAQRGFPVVIGRLKTVLARISSLPRSVFLAKGMGPQSVEKFRFIRGFGHEIVAWDEEALVHFPAEIHFAKRVSPEVGRYVGNLFAWGPENAALWRKAPQFAETRIHVTGNARGDLLRPELRGYFAREEQECRGTHGDFILVNTNFPLVNSNRTIFRSETGGGEEPALGIGGRAMTREFAEHLQRHKNANFERFQRMIPGLEKEFPDVNVVIRPHPSEKPEVYHRIARDCSRVRVVNEGNVIPWLLAARANIHNGCTTGVEANVMERPTISYGPIRDEVFDFGTSFHLPNLLSHRCPDFESLRATLGRIFAGELGAAGGQERSDLMREFLASRDGPLASERIVDVLEEIVSARPALPRPPLRERLDALRRIGAARVAKLLSKNPLQAARGRARQAPDARRAVYPEISLEEMRARVARFEDLLGRPASLEVEKVAKHLYRISA